MRRERFVFVLASALAFASVTPVTGQAQSRISLFGVITDRNGNALASYSGLALYLAASDGSRIGPVLPTDQGRFAFYGVSDGQYTCMITGPEQEVIWRGSVTIPQAQPFVIRI